MAETSGMPRNDITLAALDVEIHAMERSLAAFKSRRNTFCSVNKLPPEIIAHMFHRLRTRNSSHLLYVTHVCRHWRIVALDNPSLWTTISLSKYRPQQLAALLTRSKSYPLTVYLRASSKTNNQVIVSFLCQNLPRIREIRLIDQERHHIVSLDLDAIFSAPSSCLEKLEVAFDWESRLPTFTFGSNYPALKTLKMWRQALQWNSCSIGGLQELVLEDIRTDHQPNLSQIVSILNACPALEILTLDQAGPTLETKQVVQSIRSLHFPQLKKLRMYSNADACAALLSHMTISNAACWDVQCRGYEALDVIPRSNPSKLICKSLSISLLSPYTRFEATVHCIGEEGGRIHTKVSFSSNHISLSNERWFDFYRMSSENTCWNGTTKLTLILSDSPPNQAMWSSFFELFSRLTTLRIYLPDAFRNQTTDVAFLLSLKPSNSDSHQSCICPNLYTLHLDGLNIRADSVTDLQGSKVSRTGALSQQLRILLEISQSRHTHHARLKKLELRNCRGVAPEEVAELGKWVDEVNLPSKDSQESFSDEESSEETGFCDDGNSDSGGSDSSDSADSDES